MVKIRLKRIMGGKYFILARNYDDILWQFDLYTNSFIKFIWSAIKCILKYELIDFSIRK